MFERLGRLGLAGITAPEDAHPPIDVGRRASRSVTLANNTQVLVVLLPDLAPKMGHTRSSPQPPVIATRTRPMLPSRIPAKIGAFSGGPFTYVSQWRISLVEMLVRLHTVAEAPQFGRDAASAGLTESEVRAIVDAMAADPRQGDEVQGSGGVRKVRIAGRGKGKSGGYRVMVAYVGDDAPVYLLALLSKGDRENFTDREVAAMKAVTTAIKQARRKAR